MDKTVEELMQPRYIVIADYPGLDYKVGYVLNPHPIYGFDIFPYPEKYPHIFKPLNWYEERELKDMPEYVLFVESNRKEVHKVVEWGTTTVMNHIYFLIEPNGFMYAPIESLVIPATKDQFEQYESQQLK